MLADGVGGKGSKAIYQQFPHSALPTRQVKSEQPTTGKTIS
jgi:hypothetical protein